MVKKQIGKTLKQRLCLAGALGMVFLSLSTTPVYAVNDTETGNAVDPAADSTAEQYYFVSENGGVAVPDWNTSSNIDETKKIVVAVVGSGVDYNHADLKNVMWTEGEDYEALTKLEGGRYGYNADGILQEDKTYAHDDPMDESGEGTQAAGILAADWNGTGISGALSGVSVMAVKATGSHVSDGLEYVLAAKNAGVNVAAVFLSLTSCTAETESLITQLGKAGVVTVIAAGDQGKNIDSGSSPAAVLRNNPYVITAGAADREGALFEKSNYGTLNCDILAPGADILTTDITKTEETDSGEEPAVSETYTYVSSTTAASAVVTAAAVLLYDNDPSEKADVRAARILQTADRTEELEDKVSAGFLNIEAALDEETETTPLVNYAEIKDGELIIHGYDFGAKRGTVKVDGEKLMASSWVWKDQTITAKTDSVSGGVHTFEITRSEDDQKGSRDINVDGEDAKSDDISAEGIDKNFTADAAAVLDRTKFLFGHVDSETWKAYSFDEESQKWIEYLEYLPEEEEWLHDVTDAAADSEYLYVTRADQRLLKITADPAEKTLELMSEIKNIGKDARVSVIDDQVIVSFTDEGSVVIAKTVFDEEDEGTLSPITRIDDSDLRCLDVVKTGEDLYAVCVDAYDGETNAEQLVVYKLEKNPETGDIEAEEAFRETETHDPGTYDNAGAVSNGETISVYHGDESGAVLDEYDPDGKQAGKPIRETTLSEEPVESLNGEIGPDGKLFIAGNTDAEEDDLFIKDVQTAEKPEPEPTDSPGPTSTPTTSPTAKPTSKPSSSAAPSAAPASGTSSVVTCQDAGFPNGYYWDESKKACVAPMTPPPANNGTGTNGQNGNTNGTSTYVAPGNNNGNTNTGTGGDDAETTAEPTETTEVTPTPSETPKETEAAEAPIEIVNTKGILWFLGIPVLMILSGLGVFYAKNKGLIPWILGADALGSIALAILDHSVVGWILVVLNLAAVGLLALYRSGKQDEEEEDFDE